jgi:hypothetical protein
MQLETLGAVCDAVAVACEPAKELATSVAKVELHLGHEELVKTWKAEQLVVKDEIEGVVHGFAGEDEAGLVHGGEVLDDHEDAVGGEIDERRGARSCCAVEDPPEEAPDVEHVESVDFVRRGS